ncbi:MAG: ABC transporter ATP-binding protein, partial [Deltaproteobacteria bacterium]|nr:ABC transporter ATP-binding protein [Deltaproteobacteria bacterium]
MVLLEVEDLHTYYGSIEALQGVSLTVRQGEIVTLIGSNGAGKTTLLNTVSGLLKPHKGRVTFKSRRIDGMAAHKIVSLGISQSPEGRKIFTRLTVRENLEMGAYIRRDRKGIHKDMEQVFALFPRLKERQAQVAGTLSGGEQQMLAMGRALMTRPELVLLDEPSMGLAPVLVETIFKIISDVNSRGATILLVEQNALMAFLVASRGYVMQSGRIVLEDSVANLEGNE